MITEDGDCIIHASVKVTDSARVAGHEMRALKASAGCVLPKLTDLITDGASNDPDVDGVKVEVGAPQDIPLAPGGVDRVGRSMTITVSGRGGGSVRCASMWPPPARPDR